MIGHPAHEDILLAPPVRLPKRYTTVVDRFGQHQRIVLDEIESWRPDKDCTIITMRSGCEVWARDPQRTDDILCKAFYELTPAMLGL